LPGKSETIRIGVSPAALYETRPASATARDPAEEHGRRSADFAEMGCSAEHHVWVRFAPALWAVRISDCELRNANLKTWLLGVENAVARVCFVVARVREYGIVLL